VTDVTMPGLEYNDEDDMVPIPPLHNLINEIEDESIANVFCFGVFADKVSDVVYNDCMGDFPYMSLDGNVCFFCNVPLRTQCNTDHTHRRPGFRKDIGGVQKELRIFG
jgi:hypothetical protein